MLNHIFDESECVQIPRESEWSIKVKQSWMPYSSNSITESRQVNSYSLQITKKKQNEQKFIPFLFCHFLPFGSDDDDQINLNYCYSFVRKTTAKMPSSITHLCNTIWIAFNKFHTSQFSWWLHCCCCWCSFSCVSIIRFLNLMSEICVCAARNK